jgi:hypothetical protein
MPASAAAPTPTALDAAGPVALQLYQDLLAALRGLGPFEVEVKKTSIHLVRKTAFAGVAPRKAHLVLTLKSDRPVASPRIFKSEQTSASRWHHEVKITAAEQIDAELLAWLRAGYELSG